MVDVVEETIESVTAMIEATEIALANLKRLRVEMNMKLNREKCDAEGHKWTRDEVRAVWGLQMSKEETIRNLLKIIDSKWLKSCEALAYAHGMCLDPSDARRFGEYVADARMAVAVIDPASCDPGLSDESVAFGLSDIHEVIKEKE